MTHSKRDHGIEPFPQPQLSVESTEDYIERLEERIRNQRANLVSMSILLSEAYGGANKWDRSRIALLERALGQSEARGFKRREQRSRMHVKLVEARAEIERLTELLEK